MAGHDDLSAAPQTVDPRLGPRARALPAAAPARRQRRRRRLPRPAPRRASRSCNFAFKPGTLKVKRGARVTFANTSNTTHTATKGGTFDTKRIAPGKSKVTVQFDKRGHLRLPLQDPPLHEGQGRRRIASAGMSLPTFWRAASIQLLAVLLLAGSARRRPPARLLRGLGLDRRPRLLDALRRDHLLVRAAAGPARPARRRPRRATEPARRPRRPALGRARCSRSCCSGSGARWLRGQLHPRILTPGQEALTSTAVQAGSDFPARRYCLTTRAWRDCARRAPGRACSRRGGGSCGWRAGCDRRGRGRCR